MKFSPFQQQRQKILFEIFDRFPDLSNRGTAMILMKDYPEYFKDTEDARSLVRLYRGAKGEEKRKVIKIKKYYR